ncbi:uncharacterized protein E0L32_006624 [Thyridium curvatum]|uniref:Major facilitator superfamily (MFS) profile domain-containing protein n=1 Tax=Thyridium curvatum TaxID=1093900 RepID=A0A507B6H8_9PEZI|nr:uncharacterized protein E0L32_006624 [Thyridium curvatum]TPX12979.1 hypothetical protein E0L32_006624 [Thyridium curvatum]
MLGFGHLDLKGTFNARLTLTVLLIAFSQFNFGFDNQGFASTQAMDAFIKQFGSYNEKTKKYYLDPVWVSFFNGFMYIGQASGVIIGSYISRRWGRRMCMFTMSIWAIIAATIVITSKSSDQILAARVLNYIYIGMELSVVPVFQSEITPAQTRGFVVGTYQVALYVGGLIINCIARGTGSMPGREAYMIPYGLFYVVPTIVSACIWFVPESPRWLVLKDRPEDGMKALRQLRDGKFTDQEIEEEFAVIVAGIRQEVEQGSFQDIFKRDQFRRTMVVLGCNFLLQATGQIFTQMYGALFVKSLGTINPFTVTIILAVVNTLTAILAMVLTDKLGRRFQLLVGASIQAAAMMTMGGLGTASNITGGMKIGIVSMMVVSSFGYSLGWAPTAHILSAEIPSTRCRDMTYRTASVLNVATQFAVSFSLPYLLNAPYAALGSKVGFIFGSIAVLSIVFVYAFVPDVSGRSLEEVDRLFESSIPMRKFGKVKVDMTVENTKGGDDTVFVHADITPKNQAVHTEDRRV